MKIEFLKTLWALRFEKVRVAEEESAWNYQELYDDCLVHLGVDHKICKLLKQLVKEERNHERIARDLIHICHRNHPEVGVQVD